MTFISIDQNCHSLWDAVPKLDALCRQGHSGIHCIEDVDVAFTLRGGAALPPDGPPSLARERFYRGGASDWGAALFYTKFLGRNPLEIRDMEPFTGWSTAALSRRLNCSVDELYAEFSASDNIQMVGPSYTADSQYHRTIADVRVDEVADLVRALLDHARDDCLQRFPDPDAQKRASEWFAAETARVESWLTQCGSLPDLYRHWMCHHLPDTTVKRASEVFGLSEHTGAPGTVLGEFLRNYERTAKLYNQAIQETDSAQYSLNIDQGELPFAIVLQRRGRWLRGNLSLNNGQLRAEEDAWDLGAGGSLPISRMADSGVRALVGKALVLVLGARLGHDASALALPRHGSQYMPTARRFEALLTSAMSPTPSVQPVWRVSAGFPQQLRECRTRIRLPEYLHSAFGATELRADELAERFCDVRNQALRQLDQARDDEGRQTLLHEWAPEWTERRDALNARRRELGRNPETRAQASELWDEIKELDTRILRVLAERVAETLHVSRIDFWDSRGALLPWAVALGGEKLYNQVVTQADISAEDMPDG
ncbi:MAG: hypothetical protein ACOC0L_00770 [bacterium]